MATCGCSTTKKHAILKALAVKERYSVHVALWTLQQNGVLSNEVCSINLRPAYREVRPQIQAVQKRVRALPEEKLTALDQSLSYYYDPQLQPHGVGLSGVPEIRHVPAAEDTLAAWRYAVFPAGICVVHQ